MDQLFIDSQPMINDEDSHEEVKRETTGIGNVENPPKNGYKVLRTKIGIEISNLETPQTQISGGSGSS